MARGRLFKITDRVDCLINAGYHKVTNGGRGMPASTYRKLWPKTVIRPPEYVGRFDEMLLVDSTIAIPELVKRGNCDIWVDPALCADLVSAPESGRYIAFVQLGEKNLNRSVEDCFKTFASDEVGLVSVEGLHLPVQHEAYLRRFAVDLGGSRYESVDAPYVLWFDRARPYFFAHVVRHSHPFYGSASRGVKVIAVP